MWRLAAGYAVVEAAQEGDVRLAGDAAGTRQVMPNLGMAYGKNAIFMVILIVILGMV